jgi:peptide/nickel transport system ATP-binding protein
MTCKVHFPVQVGGGLFPKMKPLKAVDGVSFTLEEGETLGIVGESGCGKSTLARAVLRLVHASAGAVSWIGKDLLAMGDRELRATARICRSCSRIRWPRSIRA